MSIKCQNIQYFCKKTANYSQCWKVIVLNHLKNQINTKKADYVVRKHSQFKTETCLNVKKNVFQSVFILCFSLKVIYLTKKLQFNTKINMKLPKKLPVSAFFSDINKNLNLKQFDNHLKKTQFA